ncbi:uncharacterized protein LOC144870344 [Branchiostoma floridae x Branchiostoma japonicum]
MPYNSEFSFSVLVGGHAIPEYGSGGQVFVESNLYTPASYREKEEVVVDGQTEVNEWPVTPYTIEITTKPLAPLARYTVSVDGFVVTKIPLAGGQTRVVKGFHDDERGGLAGFVFSLPRYTKDKSDGGKQNPEDVGTIRVTSNDTWQEWLHRPRPITRGRKGTAFVPATKRDALTVTGGQYTMVTTRMGRNIPAPGRWTSFVRRWKWATGVRRGVLEVKCRTGDAVRAMGFQVMPYPVVLEASNNISAGISSEEKESSAGVVLNNNDIKLGGPSSASISMEGKQPSIAGVLSNNNNDNKIPTVSNSQELKQSSTSGTEFPPCAGNNNDNNNNLGGPPPTSISREVEQPSTSGPEFLPCAVNNNDNNNLEHVASAESWSKRAPITSIHVLSTTTTTTIWKNPQQAASVERRSKQAPVVQTSIRVLSTTTTIWENPQQEASAERRSNRAPVVQTSIRVLSTTTIWENPQQEASAERWSYRAPVVLSFRLLLSTTTTTTIWEDKQQEASAKRWSNRAPMTSIHVLSTTTTTILKKPQQEASAERWSKRAPVVQTSIHVLSITATRRWEDSQLASWPWRCRIPSGTIRRSSRLPTAAVKMPSLRKRHRSTTSERVCQTFA